MLLSKSTLTALIFFEKKLSSSLRGPAVKSPLRIDSHGRFEMTYNVLIVTPNDTIRNDITETLEGMGHNLHFCGDIPKALDILNRQSVAYTVVDFNFENESDAYLEIFFEFLQKAGNCGIETIVVTDAKWISLGYGTRLMREGAFDVIDYPFPSKGRSLRTAVEELAGILDSRKPYIRNFTEGALTFFKDEIRLNHVVIARMEDIGMTVDFLKLLAAGTKSGKRKIYSIKQLMKLLNATSQQAIIAMVNRLRYKISVCLKEEFGITVGHDEIIKRKKGKYGGYYLSEKVAIGPSFLKYISISSPAINPSPAKATQKQRKDRIIFHIEQRGNITRKQAAKICRCSTRTALRDLESLAADGIVEFTGHSSLGVWQFTANYRQSH